ncbi:MAG: hypothetical protein QHI48_05420 [Bacteroidota bacterium]|nr:hypothetical protein [Bacteroidota bacterium]
MTHRAQDVVYRFARFPRYCQPASTPSRSFRSLSVDDPESIDFGQQSSLFVGWGTIAFDRSVSGKGRPIDPAFP